MFDLANKGTFRNSVLLCMFSTALAFSSTAWAAPSPQEQETGVTGNESTGYHMQVVSRSTQAVDYRHRGSTKVDIKGTDLSSEAKGDAKVEGRPGGVKIDLNLDHLRPPNSFGLAYLTYVLWAITPEGRAHNLGELIVKDGKTSLHTTTDLQAFALIVTAEPYFAVTEPDDLVIAQNIIRSDTKGGIEPVDVRYSLLPRTEYEAQVSQIPEPMYGINTKIPLDLLEARNAVRIAKESNAAQYAPDALEKSQHLLDQAEDYYRRKQGVGPIGTVAREACQAAESARVMTIQREQQEAAAKQRREQEERTAAAEAAAQAQQQAAAEAQAQAEQQAAQRAEADAQRQAAEQAKAQAEQAQQQAEQAQQQAELAQQQAQQQAQQAEQARQQAEAERAQMRARLLAQLNQVLETRDTARGLIVNMPDVLFDLGKADLKPAARERLAKVAGILIAYPDIHIQIDGYTDSTGSLEFNERLSQERADAVQSYLASQGVNTGTMSTQGFGPSDPIASNDTPSGRQQNRRVELVVSGSAIGQITGQGQSGQYAAPGSGQANPASQPQNNAPPAQTMPAPQNTNPGNANPQNPGQNMPPNQAPAGQDSGPQR